MKDYGHEYADIYYYTPSEFEKLGGLWPLRTGHNIAKANYSVGPRVIECFSFHFVLDGSLTLSSMGETVTLSKDSMFCLFPDVKHSYWIHQYDPEAPLRLHWLAYGWTGIKSCSPRASSMRSLSSPVCPYGLCIHSCSGISLSALLKDEYRSQEARTAWSSFGLLCCHRLP